MACLAVWSGLSCDAVGVPLLLLGLLAGTAIGVFLASLFAVNARQRGEDDANELADALEAEDAI